MLYVWEVVSRTACCALFSISLLSFTSVVLVLSVCLLTLCRSETVNWRRDKTRCWQQILTRMRDSRQLWAVAEDCIFFVALFSFLILFRAQNSSWYYRHLQFLIQTFALWHSELSEKLMHTPALSLSVSFCSFPLSSSPLLTDTNIPNCGLTADATTDFLLRAFQAVAQWHKTAFKNMTFLKLRPPCASMS